ncbi:hypothetical protein ACIBKY_48280 [Nonomuraea sp. NPDC050394]|uniref:hypothetical protein n=1 Tax=Nonomuraea sp. NPDC050394 TaxID=3364363 RepID=UPI0037A34242
MTPLVRRTPAEASAIALRSSLRDLDVTADVHVGHGIALVSVWVELLVWCDGFAYRWWSGRISPVTGRRVYTTYSAESPGTVARALARRLTVLRETHPLSPVITELNP